MLTARKRKRPGGEIPTASLPDIVFMLLVFFLVTTTIDMDKGLGLVLPAKGEETEVSKKNITNIFVNAAGKVAIGSGDDIRIVEIRDLRQEVSNRLLANDKMIFSVRTDSRTKYQAYLDVMDQLKLANAKRISIAEPEG
ncbi:MAG: biopolymer transporter ExbD [Candidatus Marinimicrobia bacterium]|nr:biopolymer transporter ExbD [Candidatus Neomarinimicrobiota bacterium]MCF7840115.1 biopolymer transporter ExbD [Candidatus Neomarinimicrobiota bacterium]MCF7902649.1 biopolymer transporter ExbD [Candidatus Neomarinimicrobiota bacterium]